MLVARADPPFDCLSLCVSLAQREFGLSDRDCRTTKMRERDVRAAIAANAAQIRLCVKTIIARLPQSPGTGGGICKAEKSKTRERSDTQFVAVDAALIEPVSADQIPCYTGICWEFLQFAGNLTIETHSKTPARLGVETNIPYAKNREASVGDLG